MADRATHGEAELLLLRARLEIQQRLGGSKCAIANEIEIASVELIGAGFRDHVDDRASGSSQFCAVGVRGDPELLHNFIRELVRSAIAAACLREEGIVVVSPVYQITRLIAADPAKGQVTIRARR